MNLLAAILCGVVSRFGDRQGVPRLLEPGPVWPKHIYMMYHDLDRVPNYVHAALRRYAQNYSVTWYNEADCLAFMREHASPRAQKAYARLPNVAHRCDLWRYHVLKVYGGLYLDVDTVLKVPLDTVFTERAMSYTAITKNGNALTNGIMVLPAHSPLLDDLIDKLVSTVLSWRRYVYSYATFTEQFYQTLMARPHQDWHLFQERCSSDSTACNGQLDRYGLCCNVYDGSRVVMGSRYPRFPF